MVSATRDGSEELLPNYWRVSSPLSPCVEILLPQPLMHRTMVSVKLAVLTGEGKGSMQAGRAFSYAFQDPQWLKKLLIALIMMIIPIVGWLILFGYLLRITQQVATGTDSPLPEWDDFGRDLVLGLKGALTYFVWSFPALVLSVCSQVLQVAAGASGDDTGLALGAALACVACLSIIVGLAVSYVMPLPLSRLAVAGNLNDAFALGEIFREIGLVKTPLLLVLAITFVLGFVVPLGLLLCGVGILATLLYAFLVQAHLWGQIRRQLLPEQGSNASAPVVADT